MSEQLSRLAAIRTRFLERLEAQRLVLERSSRLEGANSEVHDIVHKIAGMAGSLGFPDLSAAASAVDMLLVNDNTVNLPGTPQFDRLMKQIETDLAAR